MSIRRTLWALPVVSTAIFAIGLSVSAWLTTQSLETIQATGSIDYPVLDNTSALITDVQGVSSKLKGAIMAGEKEGIALAEEQAKTTRGRIKELSAVPGQQALADRLGKEFDAYFLPAKAGTEWMMGIATTDEKAAVEKAEAALKVLEADLRKTNADARRQFAAGIAQSEKNVQQVLNSTIVSALVVVLCLVGVSHLVVRSVWSRLGGEPEYAREIASAVASGDLSMDIRVEPGDEKSLLAAIRRMKQMLEEMIGEIKNSGATIKTASSEIAAGNADLSARTESQASSLEEIAAAMDEMTSTVRKNVDHALNANKMSLAASEVAERGGHAVEQAVATMEDINKSAQKIADIIGVIDGIAFQTNILALNAAVEAARAGEQGRGFAVVASEVRNLAQRSAAAAREIKELINDSVEKVDAGSIIVNQAGATMAEIVTSVKDVAGIMNSITTASQDQSSGIQEISKSIAQIDEGTQQNAAMVEQASAAAASLQQQADTLGLALSVFRLSAHADHRSPPAAIAGTGQNRLEYRNTPALR